MGKIFLLFIVGVSSSVAAIYAYQKIEEMRGKKPEALEEGE